MNFALAGTLSPAVPHQGFVLAVFLLSLRLSAVFLLTPVLYAFSVPATARLLLVIGLSAGLALGIPAAQTHELLVMDGGQLLAASLKELALGATLALGILTAFAAISMAGRFIDVQVGFGIAQVFDPVTQRQVPVLTSAFDKLGVIVFFLVDGHHALLRGLAYSLDRFPLGRTWPLEAAAPLVIKQVVGLFALALGLAAPVVICLLMVELALGVVARNLPQMNMFVVGIPIKIIVGLAALSLWFAGAGDTLKSLYGSIYRTRDAVFAVAPAAATRTR
jgi:flagellar biosynthetic protein FliR